MVDVKKGVARSDLLTDQEHKLIGSTIGIIYVRRPYTPKAVIDGKLSVEECNKLRQKYYHGKIGGTIVSYYGIEGTFGSSTIEPLDTNPNSPTYGQTIRDPILISSDKEGGKEDEKDKFPHKREEPKTRLGHSNSGLEKALIIITSVSFIFALFFLSTNITGNAIGNLSQNSTNVVGIMLLVAGLVAGYFWMKGR